jgi:hypothetical protein
MKAMRVRQAGRETNPFALSPDEQQTATIRTPDGRDIPLADAVVRDPLTQQIKPFYAQALTEFDAANTERVKQGKAPLSADAAEVVKAWEQHSMMLQAGREQQIRQEVSAAGMRMILPDVRGGWDLAGEQLVAGPDAEKLTGLTSAAIAERLTAMGQAFQEAKPMSRFFSSAPYGFTVRSLALVRASQKK